MSSLSKDLISKIDELKDHVNKGVKFGAKDTEPREQLIFVFEFIWEHGSMPANFPNLATSPADQIRYWQLFDGSSDIYCDYAQDFTELVRGIALEVLLIRNTIARLFQ